MLKQMLNKLTNEQNISNKFTGEDFIRDEDLAIIVDDMNEMELRSLAASEMGDHVAYTVNLAQLTEWYSSFRVGLIE